MIEVGNPALNHILKNIHNENLENRNYYTCIIGKIGNPKAISFLVNEIKKRETLTIPLKKAIINIGEPISSDLVYILYHEKDKNLQKDLVELICKIGGNNLTKLIPLTLQTEYRDLWPDIISSLQGIDDPIARETVDVYYAAIESERTNEWEKRAKEIKERVFR